MPLDIHTAAVPTTSAQHRAAVNQVLHEAISQAFEALMHWRRERGAIRAAENGGEIDHGDDAFRLQSGDQSGCAVHLLANLGRFVPSVALPLLSGQLSEQIACTAAAAHDAAVGSAARAESDFILRATIELFGMVVADGSVGETPSV